MTNHMTTGEFMTTLKVARIRYPIARDNRAAYEAGHAARGHRPESCIHGTNQWTDYDNICGGCEDGVTLRQQVVEDAYRDTIEFGRRLRVVGDALNEARRTYMPLDSEALWKWAAAPFADLP